MYIRINTERNLRMKQSFGMDLHGDLKTAVRGINRPQFLMLFSNAGQFEIGRAHV